MNTKFFGFESPIHISIGSKWIDSNPDLNHGQPNSGIRRQIAFLQVYENLNLKFEL